MFQRFQNIGVCRGVATEQKADERHRQPQVREINRAPQGVGRLAEVQYKETGAGSRHAEHLIDTAFPTREISQAVADGDDIKTVFRKGQLLRVALQELRIADCGLRNFSPFSGFLLLAPVFGDFEHLRAEIESGGGRAALRESERDIAGAATKVEGACVGSCFGQFNDLTFPVAVHAETLEVVQKIVTAGDAGEEVVDFRGSLFAGRVKFIAHLPSLAVGRGGAKPRNIFAPECSFASVDLSEQQRPDIG